MKKNLRIAIITILILSFCGTTIFATNIESLQEKQNEINTQIEQKNEELTGVQTQISEALQEIEKLTEKITGYELEVENLTNQSIMLKNSVSDLEDKLKVAEKKYNEQKKLTEERLLVIYESGETSYLDVLLNTKSISEFISTYFYLTEIVKNDTEVLQDLERERNKIETAKETLEKQKNQLKAIRNNKEKTSIVLENTKVLQNNYKNKLTEEEKILQEEIEKYEAELKQVQAEIVILTTGELGEDYQGGIMAWPVPGYTRITSEYGMRFHPILHIYKIHTGIDIGAPTGANFIAASDGVIVKAGYNSAYGNMVVIDHGGGISTLYAHGSAILVQVGQSVKRGEPVLKVGSTGYSTGPHAHFEVRINGKTVQPLDFLKNNTKTEVSNEAE